MQLYGRGLRRRLPDDARRRRSGAIRMAYSLAFSLPGTPVLFYGEEIGMGENLAIEGRYARARADAVVREPHGGFSHRRRRPRRADRRGARSARERVNVAAQRARPGLAAELVRAPDPPPARVPGARLRGS